jgi:hypothetical protein
MTGISVPPQVSRSVCRNKAHSGYPPSLGSGKGHQTDGQAVEKRTRLRRARFLLSIRLRILRTQASLIPSPLVFPLFFLLDSFLLWVQHSI